MEVTSENFDDLLPEILEGIEECSFIAVDTELTGLHPTDEKDNFFDTVEERYTVLHRSATKFLIVQYGMVLFFYDQAKDEFSHRAYNFYIFPKQCGNAATAPNIRFLCESSSLEFLASWGFDFNKLIYKGIPYLSLSVEQKMKENYDKKRVFHAEDNTTNLPVPENLKKFMEDTEAQVSRLMSGNVKELFLEDLNPFQRKLVFSNIKPKFSDLYFESIIRDRETADSDSMDASSISESDTEIPSPATAAKPVATANNNNSTVSANGTGTGRSRSPSKSSRPSYNRVLRVVKMTEKERKAREDEKKRQAMDSIEKGVGFSKVIRKISETGKVVVGHNMVLDVAHSVHQFVAELPGDLADFKSIVQTAFSNLVDTKLMCCTHPFREYFTSTVLADVLKRVQEQPFALLKIKKDEEKPALSYDLNDNKCHEAGYDAFITGVCFIGLCQYLGTLQNPKKPRVLPNSPLVMPFLNKLYLMRMLDISYLNISGTDLTPSRDHVFHVNCPKEATTKSIIDMFNSFGQVQIRWQDDNNLFVALQDKDQAPLVMKNIEYDKSAYKIIPFAQYQSSNKMSKRPLDNKKGKSGRPGPGNKNPRGPRQHSSASTSSTGSSSSDRGSVSPPLSETVHHQKKKRPKTEKPAAGGGNRATGKPNLGGGGGSNPGKGQVGANAKGKPPPAASASLRFEEPSNWD